MQGVAANDCADDANDLWQRNDVAIKAERWFGVQKFVTTQSR
jgi:hypothetical protein